MRTPSKTAWALAAAAVCAATTAAAVRYSRPQLPRRPVSDAEYQRIVEAITRGVLHAQRGESDGGGTRQRLRIAG